MPKKIPRGKFFGSTQLIPTVDFKKYDEKISFSFNFLTSRQDKFRYEEKDSRYFIKLLERLKVYSGWSVLGVKTCRNDAMRCHPIDWPDTTESGFGIPREEEICQDKHQFNISVNEHGRFHGFFILNVFYIVWLDPDHDLYE